MLTNRNKNFQKSKCVCMYVCMEAFNGDNIDAVDMDLVEILKIVMCNIMALFLCHFSKRNFSDKIFNYIFSSQTSMSKKLYSESTRSHNLQVFYIFWKVEVCTREIFLAFEPCINSPKKKKTKNHVSHMGDYHMQVIWQTIKILLIFWLLVHLYL